MFKTLFIYLIIINILTLLIYCLDRFTYSPKKGYQKEYSILVLAIIGGSIGTWIGTKLWPPKRWGKIFKYALSFIFILQLFAIIYLRYHG